MISPTEIVPNIVVQRWMNHQRRLNCEALCDKVKGREQDVKQQYDKMSNVQRDTSKCYVMSAYYFYVMSAYYFIVIIRMPITTLL